VLIPVERDHPGSTLSRRSDPLETNNAPHTTAASRQASTAFSPLVLYDRAKPARTNAASPVFGGLMHYIELDATNLACWFRGQIGRNCPIACTGNNALNVNGYTVYFSDRRGNKNAANAETGEYGFEDFVNPASGAGTPNNALDTGEDVNGDAALQTYGQKSSRPV
jgi:hypothetical protein